MSPPIECHPEVLQYLIDLLTTQRVNAITVHNEASGDSAFIALNAESARDYTTRHMTRGDSKNGTTSKSALPSVASPEALYSSTPNPRPHQDPPLAVQAPVRAHAILIEGGQRAHARSTSSKEPRRRDPSLDLSRAETLRELREGDSHGRDEELGRPRAPLAKRKCPFSQTPQQRPKSKVARSTKLGEPRAQITSTSVEGGLSLETPSPSRRQIRPSSEDRLSEDEREDISQEQSRSLRDNSDHASTDPSPIEVSSLTPLQWLQQLLPDYVPRKVSLTKMVANAEALASPQAYHELSTIIAYWRRQGNPLRLTIGQHGSQQPLENERGGSPLPPTDPQTQSTYYPTVQDFRRAWHTVYSAEVCDALHRIILRQRYAHLADTYNIAGKAIHNLPRPLGESIWPKRKQAWVKNILFWVVYPQYQNQVVSKQMLKSNRTNPIKADWQRFGRTLEVGTRWLCVREELGLGALMLIPSTVSTSFIEQHLTLPQLKIWTQLVRRCHPQILPVGAEIEKLFDRMQSGKAPASKRLALEIHTLGTLGSQEPLKLFQEFDDGCETNTSAANSRPPSRPGTETRFGVQAAQESGLDTSGLFAGLDFLDHLDPTLFSMSDVSPTLEGGIDSSLVG